MKECSICSGVKELNCFYSRQKRDGSLYYHPECKECSKSKAVQWRKKNRQRWLDTNKVSNSKPKKIIMMKKAKREYRENGKQLEWQQNNRERTKKYAEDRKRKTHEISEKEWIACKEYFNYCCAYCGILEQKHYEKYKEQLHKDHVDPEGSNEIDNCVPACKSCNPSKSDSLLSDWYSINNTHFKQERLDKILYWLKNYISIMNEQEDNN